MSDDGRFALVQFVARDKSAFNTILANSTIQTFLKGRDNPQALETAFKLLKKNFDMKKFGVIVP